MNNRQTARAVTLNREGAAFELVFEPDEAVLSRRGDYTSVSLGICDVRGKPGDPALPWRRFYVFLPNGASVGRLNCEIGTRVPLASDVLIQPIQPGILMSVPPASVRPVGPNPDVYAGPAAWPEKTVQFVAVRRLGGMQMAEAVVCPFQYFPARRQLDLVLELAVKIELERRVKPLGPSSAALRQFKHRMAERVRAMVINPEDTDYRQ